jgi:hypothetical protein
MHLLGSDFAKSKETLGEVVSFEASEIAPPSRFKNARIRQSNGGLPKPQKSDPRALPKRPVSARAPTASQVSLLEPFLK